MIDISKDFLKNTFNQTGFNTDNAWEYLTKMEMNIKKCSNQQEKIPIF